MGGYRNKNVDEQEISILVGRNLKRLRLVRGMSQEKLADELGVTFQQVQKYEKGTNRIAAPKMLKAARILECGILNLYDGCGAPDGTSTVVPDLSSTGLRLAITMTRLPQAKQETILQVARIIAKDNSRETEFSAAAE